ncbi:MAG: hypothetical protein ACJ72M_07260 [Propionibacteriaceae bacterium]
MLFSGRAQATPHHERLVARGTSGASAMGEPPIGPNMFLRGQDLPHRDGTIVERWRTRTVT